MTPIKQNFMTDNQKFKKWMDSIPYGEYNDMRLRVINECKITPATYGNWRNGSCSIPPLAKEKLINIAAKDIFNEEETAQVDN